MINLFLQNLRDELRRHAELRNHITKVWGHEQEGAALPYVAVEVLEADVSHFVRIDGHIKIVSALSSLSEALAIKQIIQMLLEGKRLHLAPQLVAVVKLLPSKIEANSEGQKRVVTVPFSARLSSLNDC